mmetsp:Transcript_921/g.1824  ORF Transcript_921/g.1824 Transcript_921/m.1824 type:complete len:510 (+) Transcript_921:93-1622(+)
MAKAWIVFLALVWPALGLKLSANGQVEKRIYYFRDAAGLSNVRLQFEVMVAIAAVHDRVLVIPPPTKIAHVPDLFSETNVWSDSELSKVIKFRYAPDSDSWEWGQHWCPAGSFQLINRGVEQLKPGELPDDKDWCFGEFESRIRHFECLQMFRPQDQMIATTAVFNGLQIRYHWMERARQILRRMGLRPGEFVSAHVRRGDFIVNDPETPGTPFSPYAVESVYPMLRKFASQKPLLICTDESDSSFLDELGKQAQASFVHSTSSYLGAKQSTLEGAITDMLLCAMAGTFVGTPSSTFSQSISQLRLKHDLCNRAPMKRTSAGLDLPEPDLSLARVQTAAVHSQKADLGQAKGASSVASAPGSQVGGDLQKTDVVDSALKLENPTPDLAEDDSQNASDATGNSKKVDLAKGSSPTADIADLALSLRNPEVEVAENDSQTAHSADVPLALTSRKATVSATRWFDISRLKTYKKEQDDHYECHYSIDDFGKITEYKAFDYNKQAVCQLTDVQ